MTAANVTLKEKAKTDQATYVAMQLGVNSAMVGRTKWKFVPAGRDEEEAGVTRRTRTGGSHIMGRHIRRRGSGGSSRRCEADAAGATADTTSYPPAYPPVGWEDGWEGWKGWLFEPNSSQV